MAKKETVSGSALDFALLKRILTYVKPHKFLFYATAVSTILVAFLGPARPWLVQYTVDNHILSGDLDGLKWVSILMVGLLMVEGFLQYFQTYYANKIGQEVIYTIRMDVFKHLVSLRLKYFDKTPIGRLVTRVVSDIETIANIFSDGILIILGDVLKLLVVVGIMLYMDWRLTLVSLVSIPLLLVSTVIFKNAVKSAFQSVRTQVSRLNTFVQEHLTGMNVVQIFNRQEKEMQSFRKINAEHRNAHIRSIWAYSIFFPVVEILSAVSLATLVWWGAGKAMEGVVSLGDLIAFILWIYMLFRPIRQLADRFNVLQMGMVGSERVFQVLDTTSRVEQSGTEIQENIKGEISFKNVWFSYVEEEWVLKNLSFECEAGTTLAIVGATGAGKSSIINILGRFYEYSKGEVFVDGVEIRDYNMSWLRSNVCVVLQDVFLFSDSIYNNIALGDKKITLEKVKDAAKAVGAEGFISKLPNGYEYHVGERGGMLSVGQRQLISFIRAYVHDPAILVLDEATSSVDTETEEAIKYAISKLTSNRTSIIIAHRLSTVQHADRILVLDKGEIIEQGNHHELIEQNGQYKTLFELQYIED